MSNDVNGRHITYPITFHRSVRTVFGNRLVQDPFFVYVCIICYKVIDLVIFTSISQVLLPTTRLILLQSKMIS